MTDQNHNDEAPVVHVPINILPVDSHGDILVQLIRGQERSATALELQNRRLFGGDGMSGMLPAMIEQTKDLAKKLDANKDELLDRIEDAKKDLKASIDTNKEKTDADIKEVRDSAADLSIKVNWFAGGLAALGTAATFVLGAIGIYHRAHQ
jgi:hypothetical protein